MWTHSIQKARRGYTLLEKEDNGYGSSLRYQELSEQSSLGWLTGDNEIPNFLVSRAIRTMHLSSKVEGNAFKRVKIGSGLAFSTIILMFLYLTYTTRLYRNAMTITKYFLFLSDLYYKFIDFLTEEFSKILRQL